MTVQLTPKWGLRYYQGTDTPAGFTQQENLAKDVENLVAPLDGTFAAKPAATTVKIGRIYYANDTGQTLQSDGTNWKELPQVPVGLADLGADSVNSSKIVAASVTDGDLASPNNATWKTVHQVQGTIGSALAAGIYVPNAQGGSVSSVSTSFGTVSFWLPTSSDYDVANLTAQVRIKAVLATNAIASAVNYQIGLCEVTALAGSVGSNMSATLGAMVAGTIATFTAPAASIVSPRQVSSASALSAYTGKAYVAAISTSGTTANNTTVSITISVEIANT